MGFRTFTTVGELLCIIVLQFVGHPPDCMEFDFIVITPLLPSHCSPSCRFTAASCLGHGGSFLLGSSILLLIVDGYSTASCDFGVLAGAGEHVFFCYTILNRKPFDFPFSAVFVTSHKFGFVVFFFSFSFVSRYFLISFVSSLTHWLLKTVLFNFHVFVIFYLLLISTFIPLG